jgi:hypothetical protein
MDLGTIGNYVPIRKKRSGFYNRTEFCFYCAVQVKVEFNLEEAMKAQRENSSVALTARHEQNL